MKTVVGRNITFFSKKELDTVRSEYGEIFNSYETSIGIDKYIMFGMNLTLKQFQEKLI